MSVLSAVSSEMSLVTLNMMSTIRYYTFSHIGSHVSILKVVLVTVSCWIFATVVCILPVLNLPYFGRELFLKTGSCLIQNFLPGLYPGWEYVMMVFLIVNCLGLLGLVFLSVAIGTLVANVQKKVGSGSKHSQRSNTNVILAILVVTNLMCWLPLQIMMIFSLSGVTISPELSNWMAVFVLPLNSMTNPLLYTVRTMKIFTRKKEINKEHC